MKYCWYVKRALQNQGEQRAAHAHDRDHDRDGLERVGNRERAIEDPKHFGAQRPVGMDEDPVPISQAAQQIVANSLGARSGREVN